MHFWCTQTSVYLQSVCAHAAAAHFLRLLCLLITVKSSQLETETHQGIKGISVGWCVTELNHCLLFWYVLWFRKRSKEDVGATPWVSEYESKLLMVWLWLQNYLFYFVSFLLTFVKYYIAGFNICTCFLNMVLLCPYTWLNIKVWIACLSHRLSQAVRTLLWKACLWTHSSPSWSGAPSRMAPSGSTGRPCTSSARSSVRLSPQMFSMSLARSTFSVQFSLTTYR